MGMMQESKFHALLQLIKEEKAIINIIAASKDNPNHNSQSNKVFLFLGEWDGKGTLGWPLYNFLWQESIWNGSILVTISDPQIILQDKGLLASISEFNLIIYDANDILPGTEEIIMKNLTSSTAISLKKRDLWGAQI